MLNEKLAKWVGLCIHEWTMPNGDYYEWYAEKCKFCGLARWDYDFETRIFTEQGTLPNFTESLDACFKWLVPKAQDELGGLIYVYFDAPLDESEEWACRVSSDANGKMKEYEEVGKTVALALCKAIERLVEK